MAPKLRPLFRLAPALVLLVMGCPADPPPILGPADPSDAVFGPSPSLPPVATGQTPDQTPEPVFSPEPEASPSTPSASPSASVSPPGDDEGEVTTPEADRVVVQAPAKFRGKGTVTVTILFPQAEAGKAGTNDVREVEVVLNEDELFGVETVARGTVTRSLTTAHTAVVQFTDVIGDKYKVEAIPKGLDDERLGSGDAELKLEDDASAAVTVELSIPPSGEVGVEMTVEGAE